MADGAVSGPSAGERPAGRKLRADAQRNYDAIVAVARAAFAEHGVQASLDDIAKRAGVGPGTLYRHFPSRSRLHRAVLDDWIAEVETEGETLIHRAESDPGGALDEWMHRYLDYKSFFRGLNACLLADPDDDDTRSLYGCKAVLGRISDALIDAAKQAGLVRSDVEAHTVMLMVSGVGLVAEQAPTATVDVDTQLRIILDGIRP